MAPKKATTGEKIGTVQVKLGRRGSPTEDQPKATGYVNLRDLPVETGDEHIFELVNGNGIEVLDSPVTFRKCVAETQKSVFIPKSVIESNDLLPGHSLSIRVYNIDEPGEQQSLSDTADLSETEKIDEIHSMLTDLHEAAFGKND